MAGEIVWTLRAKKELFEILEYWNERNGTSSYSLKLNNLILVNLQKLIKQPKIGKVTNIENVRVQRVDKYYLYYEMEVNDLYVLSVRHVKRNPETLGL
jgi:toxin YoeB